MTKATLEGYFDTSAGWYGSVLPLAETRLIRKDGASFIGRVSISGGKYNNETYYVISCHDATECRKMHDLAVKDITDEKDKWEELINRIPMVVYIHEPGYSIWMNDFGLRVTGYSRTQWNSFAKKDLFKIVSAEDYDSDLNLNRKKMYPGAEGSCYSSEFRLVCADGKEICVMAKETPLEFDSAGNPTKILGTAFNISERKVVEELIKNGEEKYRSYFENSPAPQAIFLPSGEISQVNPAFVKALGYSKSELIGMNLNIITPAEDYIVELNALKSCVESRLTVTKLIDKSFIAKSGELVKVKIRNAILYSDRGVPEYGICTVLNECTTND